MIRPLVSRLRTALPHPLASAVRRLAFCWGWLTADLRTPPRVVVVGAQRSGTTTMFRLLSSHPQLRRPTLVKGPGYFDDNYGRGPRWYRAHFPVELPWRRDTRWAFECSGYYLFHPLAAARLARDLPDAHVVVMVRDPVARAFSAYRHERARGFEDLSFAEAVAREPERTAGEADRLAAAPGSVSYAHRHHAYLQRGEYAAQVQRFVDACGADRVHVVDADAMFADPVGTFDRLQRDLGLPLWRPDEVGRWNERPGGDDLDPELAAAMRAHFEPHDAALAQLLGEVPSWRKELV